MKKKLVSIMLAAAMSVTTAFCAIGCGPAKDVFGTQTPGNTQTGTGNEQGGGSGNTGGNEQGGGSGNTGGDNTGGSGEVVKNTKTTVYYSNSESWSSVYAYMWNDATSDNKTAWPGEKLTEVSTSGFGETQFAVEVDYSQYDRIIFNDGSGNQTKNLVVSAAVSGYYGEDGVFTYGVDDSEYGRVQKHTFTNTGLPSGNKDVYVYTPHGYSSSKKYGVLYMFDSQNLFIAADGVETTYNGYFNGNSWAADVAVTSLMKNGRDGIIIVAIDNKNSYRDQELTMSQSFGTLDPVLSAPEQGDFKNGKLDELGNFIKNTVMPWVKTTYSVYGTREKTGIAGSSSGGLAAYYLGMRDNDLYSYIGAFSPANGLFIDSAWTNFYNNKDFSAGKPKVYAYCGCADRYGTGDGLEKMLYPATKNIKSDLTKKGFGASDVYEYYWEKAAHNETYWRIAFPEFLSKMIG